MKFASSEVWDRYGEGYMSRRVFYGLISGLLLWGFFLTYVVSNATADMSFVWWEYLLIGVGIPFLGVFLTAGGPVPSLIGYHLVVVGLSAILGPGLKEVGIQEPGLIPLVAMQTAAITGIMGASGLLFPRFYERIGGFLFMALLALVAVMLLGLAFPGLGVGSWINGVALVIFSLYIGFDMFRASTVPATVDNSVDIAVSFYLDILNVFLSLLNINRD